MLRLLSGAGAYGLVQALLFARPPDIALPAGESAGWFLNSGFGAFAVAAAFFALGAILSPRRTDDVIKTAALVTSGGALAMLLVWFSQGFDSTIFPIVWAIGAGLMGVSSVAGASLGCGARRVAARRGVGNERQS